MVRVSVVGGSGFAGGELLRLLLFHPEVEVCQVTSARHAGKLVGRLHPNLRGQTGLRFEKVENLVACDLLFLCLPHGEAQAKMDHFLELAPRIIDLSADFRLPEQVYARYYGKTHARPDLLPEFAYGIAEINRDAIARSSLVACAGCNATATILGLYPVYRADLVHQDRTVVEVKVGSSEAGNRSSEASHHPLRSGCLRSFAPTGHRHVGEMQQVLATEPAARFHFSATAVDMVRGVLATSHLFLKENVSEREIWQLYREAFSGEPFMRLIKERDGAYRFPEPKLLAGTNYCDVGFALDEERNRLVVMSAIDNLVKGSAGQAVQCMNLMLGWPETTGLTFPGLHPI